MAKSSADRAASVLSSSERAEERWRQSHEGLAPGGLSPPGTPIIVAANTDALPRILRSTPEHRVRDLVLLCNGLARERCADLIGREHASQITAGVLYFGVLAPGADPVHGGDAPPTALAGPHANAVAALIEQMGPRCRVLDGLDALEPFAQRKMVWGAAMWLMCDVHRCTVSEVHDLHSAELGHLSMSSSRLAMPAYP